MLASFSFILSEKHINTITAGLLDSITAAKCVCVCLYVCVCVYVCVWSCAFVCVAIPIQD